MLLAKHHTLDDVMGEAVLLQCLGTFVLSHRDIFLLDVQQLCTLTLCACVFVASNKPSIYN